MKKNKIFIAYIGINEKREYTGNCIIDTNIKIINYENIIDLQRRIEKEMKVEKAIITNFIYIKP